MKILERLIELWDRKERLRDLWREDRDNIILQAQFGKTCKEWENLFSKVLSENGIGIKRTISGTNYYHMNTTQNINTKELQLRLKAFLDIEFVKRISFDL